MDQVKDYFLVVNVDWFFLSHRLPIALRAQKEGYKVTIFAIEEGGHGNEIRSYGFDFFPLPTSRSGSNIFKELKVLWLLFREYRRTKPAIVHHVALKPVTYGSLAAKWAGCSNVINAFAGLGFLFINSHSNQILSSLVKRVFTYAFRNNNLKFILQNPDDAEMVRSLNLVDDKKIFIIKGSGVDLNRFSYSISPKSDVIKIILVARMLYDKGVVEFVEASQILYKKYGKLVLFQLVGGEDYGNKAAIQKSELERWSKLDNLEWLGHRTDIANLYKDAAIAVLPSYREGLPKSLIEACAIGRPIVATNVPGCREVIDDGVNGYLVNPKDSIDLSSKLELLIDSKTLRNTMGKASRLKAENEFGIDQVVNKTFEVYNA